MSSIEVEKSAVISSNIPPAPSCLTSPSGIPIMDMLSCLMIRPRSQRVCSLFLPLLRLDNTDRPVFKFPNFSSAQIC